MMYAYIRIHTYVHLGSIAYVEAMLDPSIYAFVYIYAEAQSMSWYFCPIVSTKFYICTWRADGISCRLLLLLRRRQRPRPRLLLSLRPRLVNALLHCLL